MSYILLVDDEQEILEILEMTIQMGTTRPIKTAASGNMAWKIIEEFGQPALIISDFRMPDGDGASLYEKCQMKMKEVPFFVCSGNPEEELQKVFPNAHEIVAKINCFQTLKPLLIKYLTEIVTVPEYVNVPIGLLLRMGVVEVDVFVRIAKDKLIKVLMKGDMFDSADTEKYQKKFISHLAVTREDANTLILTFENFLKQKMSLTSSSAHALTLAKEALELTVSFTRALGWNEDTVRIAKATVDLTIHMVSKNHSWTEVLLKAKTDTSYGHHIALTSLLSCCIAHNLGWHSDSTKQKLVMAALLHDYHLDESVYDDLSQAGKSPGYRQHPLRAAELARSIKGLPTDVDQILLQHHESPLGTGFPRGLTCNYISPLSAVFIICQEIVLYSEGKAITAGLIEDFWIAHPEFTTKEPFKKIALTMI